MKGLPPISEEGEAQTLVGSHGAVAGSRRSYSTLSDSDDGDDDDDHRHRAFNVQGGGGMSMSQQPSFWKKAFIALVALSVIVIVIRHPSTIRFSPDSIIMMQEPRLSSAVHPPSPPQEQDHNDESTTPFFDVAYSTITSEPLSRKSPSDLGIPIYNDRPIHSRPQSVFGSVQNGSQVGVPLPTNEWYLNLIVGLDDTPGENNQYEHYSAEENRVYTIPYILDTVGPIVGIRLHYPNLLSYGTVVQSNFISYHGLTLGTLGGGFTRRYRVDEETLPSKLGVGLRWENQDRGDESSRGQRQLARYMRSSILRGMPYGTMEYGQGVAPVIASEIVANSPLVDGSTHLECGTLLPDPSGNDQRLLSSNSTASSVLVEEDVELYFPESDLTWLVFFSKPVKVQCFINPAKLGRSISLPPGAAGPEKKKDDPNAFQLRVVEDHYLSTKDEPLLVRIALANNCTTGTNVHFCKENKSRDQSTFTSVLRDHANVYPTSPNVKYAFSNPEGGLTPDSFNNSKSAHLFFDWGVKRFSSKRCDGDCPSKELITFALPHHVDILRKLDGKSVNEVIGHCIHSLHGNACLVKGNLWAMEEELGGLPNFMAPRPPKHSAIPALAKALSKDISYSLPDNYMRGGGDTYFSGKMLAKLGRIIVVAQELRGLAETPEDELPEVTTSTSDEKELLSIIRECKKATLPTEEEVTNAIDRLRRGVEIWLNGAAETKFTYDNTWGGLVNCGCVWNGDGCSNVYPNCPSYSDAGLNFGNGMYNDHHFHYGYHIYAAAIVAEYDRDWGRRYFEEVMLMIRDIANPSEKDLYFPTFRQKDWYLGNSWASGIALYGGRPYLNGRNQESSSEAIAAYEGIAMYGSVMMKAFGNGKSTNQSDNKNAYTALEIFNIGRFLASTEIRSADRYWHVYSPKRDIIYPDSYTPNVVSMMWDTMCQFQTWFGNAPYLAYGIQLLPLTPISERRDRSPGDQWIRQLYPSYVESCSSNPGCVDEGWAILLYAVLAELGHADLAMEKTLALSDDVFTSAGGSGHSLTNTLWYIGSRPVPSVPYDLEDPSTSIHSKPVPKSEKKKNIDCGCPDTCNKKVLSSKADGATCKELIQWLITNKGLNELGACRQVAGNEYPSECGACNPELCAGSDTTPAQDIGQVVHEPSSSSGCPPCDIDVCNSDMARCQISTTPFLCYEGDGSGGCSATPWSTDGVPCLACCELFKGCEG